MEKAKQKYYFYFQKNVNTIFYLHLDLHSQLSPMDIISEVISLLDH